MGNPTKRKTTAFRFRKSSKGNLDISYIRQQSTLVGSFLNLMETQKTVVIIVRLKDEGDKTRFVSVGLKVEPEEIPENLELFAISDKNLVNIEIETFDPIPAMIVVVGDHSEDLLSGYSFFLEFAKKNNIVNIDKKIMNWINSENIKITRIKAKGLKCADKSNFEKVIQSCKPNLPQKESVTQRKDVETIEIESSGTEDRSAGNKSVVSSVNKRLEKIRDVSKRDMDLSSVRTAIIEILHVLESILAANCYSDLSKPAKTNFPKSKISFNEDRIISSDNPTFEVGNLTMVEGILPLYTDDYKRAISMGNPKNPSLNYKPSTTITNIVRLAFPRHWLDGVTLRGAGGNRSLLSIWNYKNPIIDPCEGEIQEDLGESRLQALFDHAIRKSKKLSYDKAAEESMVSALSKALHYFKSKLTSSKVRKGSKQAKQDDFESVYGAFLESDSNQSHGSLDKPMKINSSSTQNEDSELEKGSGETSSPTLGIVTRSQVKPIDLTPVEKNRNVSSHEEEDDQEDHNSSNSTSSVQKKKMPLVPSFAIMPVASKNNETNKNIHLDDEATDISSILFCDDTEISDADDEIKLPKRFKQMRAIQETSQSSMDKDPNDSESEGSIVGNSGFRRNSISTKGLTTVIQKVTCDDSGIGKSFSAKLTASTPKRGNEDASSDEGSKKPRLDISLESTIGENQNSEEKDKETIFNPDKFPGLAQSDLAILNQLSDPKLAYNIACNMIRDKNRK